MKYEVRSTNRDGDVGGAANVPTHSSFVTRHSSSPIQIHVAAWAGPADRPPLVLLHGIWDTWRIFERLATYFAGERAIYALDFRGHGDSDKPDTGYAVADYAADVRDVLDRLGHEQIILLGFSLGAAVAARLVADEPDRIAGLILERPAV